MMGKLKKQAKKLQSEKPCQYHGTVDHSAKQSESLPTEGRKVRKILFQMLAMPHKRRIN